MMNLDDEILDDEPLHHEPLDDEFGMMNLWFMKLGFPWGSWGFYVVSWDFRLLF